MQPLRRGNTLPPMSSASDMAAFTVRPPIQLRGVGQPPSGDSIGHAPSPPFTLSSNPPNPKTSFRAGDWMFVFSDFLFVPCLTSPYRCSSPACSAHNFQYVSFVSHLVDALAHCVDQTEHYLHRVRPSSRWHVHASSCRHLPRCTRESVPQIRRSIQRHPERSPHACVDHTLLSGCLGSVIPLPRRFQRPRGCTGSDAHQGPASPVPPAHSLRTCSQCRRPGPQHLARPARTLRHVLAGQRAAP